MLGPLNLMSTLSKFKRSFWIKLLAGAFIGNLVIISSLYLLHRVSGNEFEHIIFLMVTYTVLLLFIPVFLTKLYRPNEKRIQELNEVQDNFEEVADELILSTFGDEMFKRLYFDDFNWSPVDGIQACKELLSKEEAKNNNEIRFYIFAKMAKYYFRDNSYQESIQHFQKALSIEPDNFIITDR